MADGRHFENRYIAYISEKSFDFDEILYTAADFELDERHAIKNEEVALDRLRVRQNVFLVYTKIVQHQTAVIKANQATWDYSYTRLEEISVSEEKLQPNTFHDN